MPFAKAVSLDDDPNIGGAQNTTAANIQNAVLPKQPTAGQPSNLPVQPNGGVAGADGTEGRDPAGSSAGEEQAQVEIDIDAATLQESLQIESRKDYAIQKSKDYRALPDSDREAVKSLRHRCRLEWEYWRTHDEYGDPINEDSDYRLFVFPSPKNDEKIQLAELLHTYTETQILRAWVKFLNRPRGLDGLDFIWINFLEELEDYVEIEGGVAEGAL